MSSPLRVSVVYHVLYDASRAATNSSIELIRAAHAQLNRDFSATNADLAQLPESGQYSEFRSVVGNANIVFEPADAAQLVDDNLHVRRVDVTGTDALRGHISGGNAIANLAALSPRAADRLNIYIVAGGDAYGNAERAGANALWLRHEFIGGETLANPSLLWRLGRFYLTHEVGHCFNLTHTFSESWQTSGSCTSPLQLKHADIPPQKYPNFAATFANGLDNAALEAADVAPASRDDRRKFRVAPARPYTCGDDNTSEQFCNYMDYSSSGVMFSVSQTQTMRDWVASHAPLYDGAGGGLPPTPTPPPTPAGGGGATNVSGGPIQVLFNQPYYAQWILTGQEMSDGGGDTLTWSRDSVTAAGVRTVDRGRRLSMRLESRNGGVFTNAMVDEDVVTIVDASTGYPLTLVGALVAGTSAHLLANGTATQWRVQSLDVDAGSFGVTTNQFVRLELAAVPGLYLGINAAGGDANESDKVQLLTSADHSLRFRAAVPLGEDVTVGNFNRSYMFRQLSTGAIMSTATAGGIHWLPTAGPGKGNAAFLTSNDAADDGFLFQGSSAFIGDAVFANRIVTFNGGADLFFGPAEGTEFIVEGEQPGLPIQVDSTPLRFRVVEDAAVPRYFARRTDGTTLSEFSSTATTFDYELVNIDQPSERGQLNDEPLYFQQTYRISAQPPTSSLSSTTQHLELSSGGGAQLFYAQGVGSGRSMYLRSARNPASRDAIKADEPFWLCDAVSGQHVWHVNNALRFITPSTSGTGTLWSASVSGGEHALTTSSLALIDQYPPRDGAHDSQLRLATVSTTPLPGNTTSDAREATVVTSSQANADVWTTHTFDFGDVAAPTIFDVDAIDDDGGDGLSTGAIIGIAAAIVVVAIVVGVLAARAAAAAKNKQAKNA